MVFLENNATTKSRYEFMEIQNLADSIKGDTLALARIVIMANRKLKLKELRDLYRLSTFNKPHGDINLRTRL